jgi:ABC-type transporter Mla MlaB component
MREMRCFRACNVGGGVARALPQMLRIQRSEEGETVVFALSGRVSADHEAELQNLLDADAGRRIVLDLADVNRVDRDGIAILARCEAAGVTLANCPEYIHEWILTDRGSSGEDSDQ